MAGPGRFSEEVDLTGHSKKKPKPTRINLFRAGLTAFFFGVALILLGLFTTNIFFLFGMLLTAFGVVFPFLYLWFILNLIANSAEGDEPPEAIAEEPPSYDARR